MARLASEARAGFYPIAPGVMSLLLKHLYLKPVIPDKPRDTIQFIDPCCGKGAAMKQIADTLGIPYDHAYGIELDGQRGKDAKEAMPGANILEPASFFGTQITGFSFGLAYVNPPFSDELGGGKREEQTFCDKATRLLTPHGIMVLVCPIRAFVGNRGFIEFFDSWFEDVAVYKFPDDARPYNEIVVLGRKRRQQLPTMAIAEHGTLHQMQAHWSGYITLGSLPPVGQVQPKHYNNGHASFEREEHIRVFEIPLGWKPNTWKKTEFTDEELVKAVEDSPLNQHLREVVERPPDRPPLPLDKGHLGLMLASGKLDGRVDGPFGTHVVRGGSRKVEYHNKEASQSTENPDTGAVTTKDVFSERPVTEIRLVDQRGIIWSHSNQPAKEVLEEGDNAFE